LKAICVTTDRKLEVRDVPAPDVPPAGHVVVEMEASAINHGDKTFLARPDAAGRFIPGSRHDVWGASGVGRVIAVGADVPVEFEHKTVAIYRSLIRSTDTIGLWSERVQVPYACCLMLPDTVAASDYCGSLVNVFTAYAFLEEAAMEGHKGVIVTAGNSATGCALAALARRRDVPVISLVRSAAAQDALHRRGITNVIDIAGEEGIGTLERLAFELGTTAVFDGVGGELISRIAPVLPMNSSIYFYGFLSGATPFALPSTLFVTRNLIMKRFSNFESATARNRTRLVNAMSELQHCIADPMFRTRIGRKFRFDQIDEAMAYVGESGAKAVLVG
jgi:NADPH:quinone reductase